MKNLKYIFILIFNVLVFGDCLAQSKSDNDYAMIYKSFSLEFHYPTELYRSGTSMGCLLKIEVDQSKHVIDMKLSDSADSLFVNEFNKNSKKLTLEWLEKYLKDEYGNSSCNTFLIPLSYTLMDSHSKTSPPSGMSVSLIGLKALSNYFIFSGKYFIGNAIILKPIGFVTGFQR